MRLKSGKNTTKIAGNGKRRDYDIPLNLYDLFN